MFSSNLEGSISYAHRPTSAHMHIFDPDCQIKIRRSAPFLRFSRAQDPTPMRDSPPAPLVSPRRPTQSTPLLLAPLPAPRATAARAAACSSRHCCCSHRCLLVPPIVSPNCWTEASEHSYNSTDLFRTEHEAKFHCYIMTEH
jgi:hypothetical protein